MLHPLCIYVLPDVKKWIRCVRILKHIITLAISIIRKYETCRVISGEGEQFCFAPGTQSGISKGRYRMVVSGYHLGGF